MTPTVKWTAKLPIPHLTLKRSSLRKTIMEKDLFVIVAEI